MQGAKSTCAVCGQVFNSTGGFDRHRTGLYEKPSLRKCTILAKGHEDLFVPTKKGTSK